MTKLLEAIDSPAKLRKLGIAECKQLANEIRTEIIKTVSKTGGHLAPNLGVVELTLALHRAFDTPKDKIVWDVGHQSYVHKLMTGRGPRFCSLRQHKGLSGFPKRLESEYDCFDTGHSSTSISAAMGLAMARDLRKENYQVVAVIGDGALTGGMAFEAMNMVGHRKTNMTVILNDNEMSIAENVGALAGYLSKIRSDPKYFKGKEDLEQIMHKIPRIGKAVLRAMERVKDSFKYLVVPGMLFEELGFTYLGPIDGHDMEALNTVLSDAKKLQEPVLVHILTKKGKGYRPAEENPDKFHGTGPFDPATGQVIKQPGPPSYTSVFGKCLAKLAEQDSRILAITAAMPEGTGLNFFAKRFPERYFDVGIAEQHGVTMAAALAADGFKPVVAIYSTFMQRAYDQVLHDVCLQNLPVVLALDRAGLVGEDGPTHHGVFDLAYLRHIPNMMIMTPKDENELQQMLVTAVDYDGPCAIRYPRGEGKGVALDAAPAALPVGQGEVLRAGEDCTILAIGSMVNPALEAAELLAARGIQAAVVNCRFVKPLDAGLILTYAKPGSLVVTVEEHCLRGGFGSAVLELLEENRVTGVRMHCMGIPDEFAEHGKPEILKDHYKLNAKGICEQVEAECQKKPGIRTAKCED